MSSQIWKQKGNITLLIHIFSLIIKYMVGLYGYSGKIKLTQARINHPDSEITRYKDTGWSLLTI